MSANPELGPRGRWTRLRRRVLTVTTAAGLLLAGPQAAMAYAAEEQKVTIDTGGVTNLLKNNALPLVVLFIGILVVASGRKKDIGSSLTMVGISLLGLAVVGMSLSAMGVGTAIFSLFTNTGG
ncbi:hypothetical protein [Streptomyces sp. NPDC059009]|uniref:hypothetical protein n=1 Tax=Streptomyces sp. NPDC059009 TaxID=3346694 RepID=UPI00369D5887